jgi:hypothetical protein
MSVLRETKKKIEKLGYPSHGLKTADGRWILKPNGPRKESNLEQIFSMLETLPPANYVVYCTKPGSRGAGYDYPVTTENPVNPNTFHLSQPATVPNPDSERLGRLEAENAFLREQCETLKSQLAEMDAEPEEMEDEGLSEDDTTGPGGLMEALAPAVPALVDRALALMDNYINRNKPQPTPLMEQNPIDQINMDQLAEMVVQRIMAANKTVHNDEE